ncbi:MAG: hypothetical protein LBG80_01570 [Bacteroidales bacterium]|jgi:hypothetical protein|nr:hypothetical protein [Bacteroidales bacterium]
MNTFYEDVLLREEFNLMQKLQKDTEFAKYVTVKYEDRVTGETKMVLSMPTAGRYPEIYIVDYQMPVYVGKGQLRNDYHAEVRITLSEPVLSSREADNGPLVNFNSNFEPFNNHVHQTTICSGNAWIVAKDNGLWHFIISLGALINQDSFVCAEGSHFNSAAFNYWVLRGRKPVTNITWPLDLTTKKTITVVPKTQTAPPMEKPKISIVKKMPEQQPIKKITIIKK